MNIGIVGLSHQGLVYASFLAKRNFKIFGFDTNKDLIKQLNTKFVSEDTKAEPLIKKNLEKFQKKIIFSDDFKKISNCDFILITEDVKILYDGNKDEKRVIKLIKKSAKYAKINSNFIILSQVKVGFAKKFFNYLKGKKKINILNTPDILTIGQALGDLEKKQTFIIGLEDKYLKFNKKINSFFIKLRKKTIFTNFNTVEVAKEAIQLKLGLDVTFVNLLSDFSKQNNSDTTKIIDYMKIDSRFSKKGYWRPGLGFGGGHIERGLKTFDKKFNDNYKSLMREIITYNEKRIYHFANDIESKLKKIKDLRIGILGLSYKKNSESTFRSYAVRFLDIIKKQKNTIFAFDPAAKLSNSYQKKFNVKQLTKLNLVLEKSNVILILCDWDNFGEIKIKNLIKNKINIVIDPYNILKKEESNFLKSKIIYFKL